MSIKHIRVASDLHLEGFSGRHPETLAIDFIPQDPRDAESVLVLPGDISSDPGQAFGFIKTVIPRFAHTIFVPGNHEYYKHNFDAWNKTMEDRFAVLADEGNFSFSTGGLGAVRQTTFQNPKLRFIFGSLWGDGGPTLADRGQVGFYLNDFRLITRASHNDPSYRQFDRRFTVDDMIEQFKASKKEIEELLRVPFDGKTVVVTHHLPSRRLVSKRFWPSDGSDGANGGFVGDCDNMICTLEPNLWIHGHTHDTIDTMLWKTRIVCNPAGYRGEWATPYNTFMARENGLKQAVINPKFVDVEEL